MRLSVKESSSKFFIKSIQLGSQMIEKQVQEYWTGPQLLACIGWERPVGAGLRRCVETGDNKLEWH